MSSNCKVKGLLKGLRFISRIFDSKKELIIEIGHPTDVKHVGHIGLDGHHPENSSASLMNELQSIGLSSGSLDLKGDIHSKGSHNSERQVTEDLSRRGSSSFVDCEGHGRDLSRFRRQSTGNMREAQAKEKSDKPRLPKKLSSKHSFLVAASQFLLCSLGTIPFSYLGIPVGASPKSMTTWSKVIDIFAKRLASWKCKFISFGGRITLLNSVLSNIPTYLLSIYKAPKKLINLLNQMQRKFLRGKNKGDRGIAWVSWKEVCKPKLCGGLGVKDLSLFNDALLGKWKWRWLTETDTLWSRVVKSKYGMTLPTPNTQEGSKWWKDLGKVGLSVGTDRDWFADNLLKELGDGENTLFWDDIWFGDQCLKDYFPRLFTVAANNKALVAESGSWINDRWCWNIQWRRNLFVWEKQLESDLYSLIEAFTCKRDLMDSWKWRSSAAGVFEVKTAYELQLTADQSQLDPLLSKVWINCAPSKVCSFAWKAIRGRLPSKEALRIRNLIHSEEETKCMICRQHVESVDHILVSCRFASSIWHGFYTWIGISTNIPTSCKDSFNLHLSLCKKAKRAKLWRMLWLSAIWSLWLSRNDYLFNDKEPSFIQVLDLIQIRSWSWFSSYLRPICFDFSQWCTNPWACILQSSNGV